MKRAIDQLRSVETPVTVRSVRSLEEALAELTPDRRYFGFLTTPSQARWLFRAGGEWKDLLAAEPRLEEVRLFNHEADLHWLAGFGVLLREGAASVEGETRIESPGWLERCRRSRLWGEWLEDTETWYEERIPDPQAYEGIEPGAAHNFVFLLYREYVEAGQIRHVRYLGLEGEKR